MDIEQEAIFAVENLTIKNITQCEIACIMLSASQFKLTNVQAWGLPSNFISGEEAMIYLEMVNATKTVELPVYGDGGFIQCMDCLGVVIGNSRFVDLKGRNGGVVYLANTNPNKLIAKLKTETYLLDVQNSVFEGCSAVTSGGVWYLSEANAHVVNTVVTGNSAYNGGAAELICTPEATSYRCDYSFGNTSFSGNWAENGGAIHYNVLLPQLNDTEFVNNRAAFGPDLAGVPCSLQALTTPPTPFELIPGAVVTQNLTFGVFDSSNQVVTSDYEDTCRVTVYTAGVTIQGNTIAQVIAGKCVFDALTVIADPGYEFEMTCTSTAVNYDKPEPNSNITEVPITIPVRMANCPIGWVLSERVCVKCPRGQYSFNPLDAACLVCSTGMECNGGADVGVLGGYWRSGNFTDSVYKCTSEENCLGGEGIGKCTDGNTGRLCAVCDEGWVRTGQFACSQCSDPTQALVIGVLGGSALLVFLLLLVYTSIKYARRNAKTTAVLLRILLNFIQEAVILCNLDLKWPNTISNVFTGLKTIWAIDYTFTSYQCSYSSGDNSIDSVFMNQRVVCIAPIVLIIFCLLIWGLVAILKRSIMYIKCHLVATYIVLHSAVLIQIFTTNLSILSCLEVENRKWLMSDTRVECWTGEHLETVLLYTLPSLLLWCVALPVALVIGIVKERKKNDDQTLIRYSFMCKGYKRYLYFWQFLIIFKKYLILLFIFMLSPESSTLTGVAMVYCFLIYIFAQMYYKPYLTTSLNLTEVSAVGFSISVLVAGLSGSNIDSRLAIITDVLMGVTFLVLLIFVVYMSVQVLAAVCTWRRKQPLEHKDKKTYTTVRPSNSSIGLTSLQDART